ncbi:MAG TPA: universal stress protein [Steroidobacteraceae bacterium]|jgi:universal stress protein A
MADYRKVLALLDLSEGSERVFNAARDLASHSNASLVALHVVDYAPVEPMGETLMPSMAIEQELQERSRARIEQLIAGSKARGRVEMGNTKAEILRVAEEERADLIVLGSRERHGLAILVNFTEDTVLHAAHCDVLAVRLS